jgi:hypothetical protein
MDRLFMYDDIEITDKFIKDELRMLSIELQLPFIQRPIAWTWKYNSSLYNLIRKANDSRIKTFLAAQPFQVKKVVPSKSDIKDLREYYDLMVA